MTTRAITFSNAPGRIRVNHETGVEIHTVRGEHWNRNTYSIWVPNRYRSIGIERVSGGHTLAEARVLATEAVWALRGDIAEAYEAAQRELDDRLIENVNALCSIDARPIQARVRQMQMAGRTIRVTGLEQAVIEAARRLVHSGVLLDGRLVSAVEALDRAQETRTVESFRCTTHGMRGCPTCSGAPECECPGKVFHAGGCPVVAQRMDTQNGHYGAPEEDPWAAAHRAGHHAHGGVSDCVLCGAQNPERKCTYPGSAGMCINAVSDCPEVCKYAEKHTPDVDTSQA